jgi:hypothetical protein
MRRMDLRHGVILLDETEIIFRIYETTDHEWKLLYFHSSLLPKKKKIETTDVLEIIGNFFASEYAQHILDWKMCSRSHSKNLVRELERTLSLTIEDISLHREQELICKGMFTELW